MTPARTETRERKHILVINDTVGILLLFTTLLEEEGYRVTTDGFSVEMIDMLERVKADKPDLIVLDFVILDEGKGWQFLQELDKNFALAARNIPQIDVLPIQGINVADILRRNRLVLTKAAVEALEARFK